MLGTCNQVQQQLTYIFALFYYETLVDTAVILPAVNLKLIKGTCLHNQPTQRRLKAIPQLVKNHFKIRVT